MAAGIKLSGNKSDKRFLRTEHILMLPHTGGIDLIVNKQSGQWGTEYNNSRNLSIARMTTGPAAAPMEEFTISIVPGDMHHGTLIMKWGDFRWMAPIEVQ